MDGLSNMRRETIELLCVCVNVDGAWLGKLGMEAFNVHDN